MIASWLFRNVNHRQVILKNTFWLTLAVGVAGLGDFLVTIYVVRTFGAVRYGIYGYAFSFVSLFSALFDFGIATAVTREFAANRSRERAFGELLGLKLLIGGVGLMVVWAGGALITRDPVIRQMIVLLSLYIALVELVNFCYALFRARQQMEFEAVFRFVYTVCLVGLVLGLTSSRGSVLTLGVAYLGAIAVTAASAFIFVARSGKLPLSPRPRVQGEIWRAYLGIGLYIALGRASGDLNQNIGAVTLGYLGRLAEIGWYNAADKIYGLMLFPMGLIASAVFPALSEARQRAPERFVRYWITWGRVTITLSVLLACLVFMRSRDIIELLYRGSFLPAALALQILVVAALIGYVQVLYYHVLLIADRQRELFVAGVVATVVHVVLNFLLVPRYGLYGVALGTDASQLVLLVQCVVLTSRYAAVNPVSPELLQSLAVALVSAAATAAVVARVPQGRIGLMVALPIGAAVYFGMVRVSGEVWRWLARR
ncbi:MAG TPA: oligosaccharide flippase family protein [bacterium]|nr:oligosaccharide flippase family protein [bacterium]